MPHKSTLWPVDMNTSEDVSLPADRRLRADLLRDLGAETLLFVCAVEAALAEGHDIDSLFGFELSTACGSDCGEKSTPADATRRRAA